MPNRKWTSSEYTLHVRLEPDDMEYVRKKAAKTGIGIGEIVRTYVCWGIELEKEENEKAVAR